MSARANPSATASLPEMRSSFSSDVSGAALVTTAMFVLSLDRLLLGVLPGDPRGDLRAADVEILRDLLLVLPAEPEAVGAHGGLLVADLGQEPGLVGGLVLAPHLPLAGVVLEHRLVDHGDAVLDRAHRLAHPAAAAGLHVGVEGRVGHDVEAGVRTGDPAEVALHARVEVDDRTHRPGRELLEVRVALGNVPLAPFLGLADGDGRDADALSHFPPARELDR